MFRFVAPLAQRLKSFSGYHLDSAVTPSSTLSSRPRSSFVSDGILKTRLDRSKEKLPYQVCSLSTYNLTSSCEVVYRRMQSIYVNRCFDDNRFINDGNLYRVEIADRKNVVFLLKRGGEWTKSAVFQAPHDQEGVLTGESGALEVIKISINEKITKDGEEKKLDAGFGWVSKEFSSKRVCFKNAREEIFFDEMPKEKIIELLGEDFFAEYRKYDALCKAEDLLKEVSDKSVAEVALLDSDKKIHFLFEDDKKKKDFCAALGLEELGEMDEMEIGFEINDFIEILEKRAKLMRDALPSTSLEIKESHFVAVRNQAELQ